MTVMTVGGDVLFWWDYLSTLDYLLYIFVLHSFYCIFKIVCPCTALNLFLAFRLQLLNKLELSYLITLYSKSIAFNQKSALHWLNCIMDWWWQR